MRDANRGDPLTEYDDLEKLDCQDEPCCPHPNSRHYVYHASISGPYEAGCHDCDCHAEPERPRAAMLRRR